VADDKVDTLLAGAAYDEPGTMRSIAHSRPWPKRRFDLEDARALMVASNAIQEPGKYVGNIPRLTKIGVGSVVYSVRHFSMDALRD
jgi:hypothetical protein